MFSALLIYTFLEVFLHLRSKVYLGKSTHFYDSVEITTWPLRHSSMWPPESLFPDGSGHIFSLCLAPFWAEKTRLESKDTDHRGFAQAETSSATAKPLRSVSQFLDKFSWAQDDSRQTLKICPEPSGNKLSEYVLLCTLPVAWMRTENILSLNCWEMIKILFHLAAMSQCEQGGWGSYMGLSSCGLGKV